MWESDSPQEAKQEITFHQVSLVEDVDLRQPHYISMDTKYLLYINKQKSILVRNIEDLEIIYKLENTYETINSIYLSPDDENIAIVSGKSLHLKNMKQNSEVATFQHSEEINKVVLTLDNKYAILICHSSVLLWRLESKSLEYKFEATGRGPLTVSLSKDEKYILVADSLLLKIWNIETREETFSHKLTKNLTIAKIKKENKFLAIVESNNAITVINLIDKSTVLIEHLSGIIDIDFTDDSEYIAIGSSSGEVLVFSLNTKKIVSEASPSEFIWNISISGDGRYLVTGDTSGSVEVFDLKKSEYFVYSKCGHGIEFIRWNEHGALLACVSYDDRLVSFNKMDITTLS
jgi:WD40 repeat protein